MKEENDELIKNKTKISKKIKILIGSNNKAKIEGAKLAFDKYFSNFEIISEDISSGVNSQPINDDILLGARNRIKGLKSLNNKDIDFYISSEAGLISIGDNYININMAVIEDISGYESIGTSQGYMIPKSKIETIKNKSLGIVLDEIFHGINLSRNKGGINYLTLGEVNRIQLVRDSFILALIPYLEQNQKIWR
jgi:inosine/xanthosine triphosphatase